MTRLIILLLFSSLLCAGQKIDVDFDAYLYRHTDSCRYERVIWGTTPRISKKERELFVIVIDQDTLELDLRGAGSTRRSAHLDGYIPGTLARYFVDLYIERQHIVVVVTDDDKRVVHQLSTILCPKCRKK